MTTIKMRRDTLANWRAANPVPADGEICVERDTKRFRIGNASNSYLGLDAFVALPEITAAIEHERVTTTTSWSALPASGNWLGRTIHIPSVKAFAYWDGTKWCIDPSSDTGWVSVTTWDAAGVVSGKAFKDAHIGPRSGYEGGLWMRRKAGELLVRVTALAVSGTGDTVAQLYESLPIGWDLHSSPAGQVACMDRWAGREIWMSWTSHFAPWIYIPSSSTDRSVPQSSIVRYTSDEPWPTSLTIT